MYCRKKIECKITYNNGVYIDLYNRINYCMRRSFIQNRTPHRLWFMRAGKVGHPHSHTDQKQWDQECYESNVSTMFFKQIHFDKIPDSQFLYKLYVLITSWNNKTKKYIVKIVLFSDV